MQPHRQGQRPRATPRSTRQQHDRRGSAQLRSSDEGVGRGGGASREASCTRPNPPYRAMSCTGVGGRRPACRPAVRRWGAGCRTGKTPPLTAAARPPKTRGAPCCPHAPVGRAPGAITLRGAAAGPPPEIRRHVPEPDGAAQTLPPEATSPPPSGGPGAQGSQLRRGNLPASPWTARRGAARCGPGRRRPRPSQRAVSAKPDSSSTENRRSACRRGYVWLGFEGAASSRAPLWGAAPMGVTCSRLVPSLRPKLQCEAVAPAGRPRKQAAGCGSGSRQGSRRAGSSTLPLMTRISGMIVQV